MGKQIHYWLGYEDFLKLHKRHWTVVVSSSNLFLEN